MPSENGKKVPLNLRVSPAIRARLEKAATAAGMTLTTAATQALEGAWAGMGPVTLPPDSMGEVGITGLLQTSGFIYEEFHPSLRGDKALQVYLEMVTNSPVVQGVLFAIDMLMRQVDWTVEAGGTSPADIEAADHVQGCLDDMSQSWQDTLTEILSMLAYGFSYHEIVYKRRQGGNPLEPGLHSRYDDGKIGWRKLPIRAQVTRWRWEFDDSGGLKGMWQAPWGLGGGITSGTMLKRPVYIPIQKALLFRPRAHKQNPEGQSLLRAAYRPWYMSKRIEEIEAIGVERDLAGLPVARIPAEHIIAKDQTFENWKQIARNVRRNEQEALVLPSDKDENNNFLYDFSLLTTGGRRQIEMEPIVERYERRIAMTMLADFLFIGQGGAGGRSGGSYALVSNRSSLFALALNAILGQICSVMNRYAIPRLLAMNGMELETLPQLRHADVDVPDIQFLGDVLLKLSQAGMPLFPDVDVENQVRRYLGFGELTDEEVEARRLQESPGTAGGDPARGGATDGPAGPNGPPEGPGGPPKPTAAEDAKAGKQELDKVLKELRESRQERLVLHQTVQPAPVPAPAPITVNIPERSITMQAPAASPVTVEGAHITVQPAAPAQVVMQPPAITVEKTQVDVHLPEQPAPSVTVHTPAVTVQPPDVHVAAPQVYVDAPVTVEKAEAPQITVNVPSQPTPEVHVDVAAPQVTIEAPKRPDRVIDVQYDLSGKPIKYTASEST
jgi:hypothetical protein